MLALNIDETLDLVYYDKLYLVCVYYSDRLKTRYKTAHDGNILIVDNGVHLILNLSYTIE